VAIACRVGRLAGPDSVGQQSYPSPARVRSARCRRCRQVAEAVGSPAVGGNRGMRARAWWRPTPTLRFGVSGVVFGLALTRQPGGRAGVVG